MNTLTIAWRNIFRNGRRSALTLLAIVVAAAGVLMFGGYVNSIFISIETESVRALGHLKVFHRGFFEYGAGKPGAYGIDRYQEVAALIRNDPALKPLIRLITPNLQLFGIAGNFQENSSKTFFGIGFIPSDRQEMANWDGHQFGRLSGRPLAMTDADTEGGVIGVGLARVLHLCGALKVPNCTDGPSEADTAGTGGPSEDFGNLIEFDQKPTAPADLRPKIDLLAATAAGAPNVVTLHLNGSQRQGAKEFDDSYVALHLDLAQRLVYGRGEHKVTALVIQLHNTRDMAPARDHLNRLFAAHHLDLEVRDFTELNAFYLQVKAMFTVIFGFIALVMGVIVLFTVVNTMSMTVMERINEIGTIRALGLRRSGIRTLFVAEGMILGTVSAAIGVALGAGLSLLFNAAQMTWIPPNNVEPVPLTVTVIGNPTLMIGCWVALVLVATLSSLLPANKAARMEVVDALRHV